jgi:hypothetical protein
MKIHDLEVTGSLIYNGVNLLSLTSSVTDSGSFSAQIVNLNQVSSSLNSFTSSINTTIKSKLDSESVISGSAQVSIIDTTGYSTFSSSISSSIGDLSSSVGSLSSSIATTTSNLSSRIGSVETKTGSYATTGSNIFVGSQVITGSLYITNDMVVQGCSCLQNITASAVSIGTNTVVLNTATPAVRFAGVSVQDSGSNAGVTGSIFWDGLCNRWIYSNPSDIGYSGGMLLSGPRTSTLGSESPLTCNYIAKSGGGDHLYDSCIIDDGTTVCVNANLKGSGTACFTGAVCSLNFIASSTCSTAGLRVYGASGTHQWDMYLNGANLRFSDNTSGGCLVVDTAASFGGTLTSSGLITGQSGIYQSNAASSIASNKFETYNGGATDMNFSYPASGTVTFTNGTPRFSIASTGAATFSNSIYGTSAIFGSDFLSNETSKVGVSFGSGYGQINAWGSNTSTYGGLKFQLSVSNGGTVNALTLTTGTATFSNTETTLNFNPQTNLLASYYYLNFGGGSIMYRNAPDMYIGSNAKYGSAGTVVANYTSANGMGLLTMDGGNLRWQANNTSVTAGTAYSVPIRFAINNDGNVGIDATTTYAKLHIGTASNNENNIFFTRQTTTANVIIGGLRSSLGPYWGDATSTSLAEINLETDNPYYRGAISFRTNNSDATANRAVERMRITSGGQVNVNSTQTTYPFYVQAALGNWTAVFDNTTSGASGILMRSTGGSQGFYYGAYDGGAYKFYVNGSGVVNSTSTSITIISSDIKLKTDIRDYDKGLAEVLAMKPRIYKRKDNLEVDEVGFIAQEMNIALVGSMIESYKDEEGEPIHTYQLEWYPLLVKAIQEQQSTICSQSQKIAILESCLGIM